MLFTRVRLAAMIAIIAAGGTVCGGPSTAEAQPTLDALLATPPAEEIVSRWKSVCFDHAGKEKNQRAAAKALGVTWPYQVMFGKDQGHPTCLLVSSIEPSTTSEALFDTIAASITPAAISDKSTSEDGITAATAIDGVPYKISSGLRTSPGNVIAVVSLTTLEKVGK